MRAVNYEAILDFFCWGAEKMLCPTFNNLLMGYHEYRDREARLCRHLAARKLIEKHGRGQRARFTITEAGRRLAELASPLAHWDQEWDGKWRVVTFDVPEVRRNDRARLWRALRHRRLGFLQRSVWIWPHDLRPILAEIIQAEGVPECFCGFAADELFLCTADEIVATAWDFEEIERRQRSYLDQSSSALAALDQAADLATLAAAARRERLAYAHAFALDPLLPRGLWPDSYRGETVLRRHAQFRRRLSGRFAKLAGGPSGSL